MQNLIHPYFAACAQTSGWIPSLYAGLPCNGDDIQLESLSQIFVIVLNVIAILTAVAGALAVIFILVSAIFYVSSAGDPSKVKRAKDVLNQSIIGLILTIGAYAIVKFLATKLS